MHTIHHYDDPAAYPRMKNGEVTEYLADTDNYDYLGKSASTTDCTGLITHGPVTDAALNSYQDVYPFIVPAIDPADDTHAAITDPAVDAHAAITDPADAPRASITDPTED